MRFCIILKVTVLRSLHENLVYVYYDSKTKLFFFIFSDLPPCQGGKYSGFGYTMDPPPRSTSQELFDSAVTSLSSFGQSVRIKIKLFSLIS